jgi:hypothetical protein
MTIVAGVIAACAMLVALCGAIFTDIKVFELFRESRRVLARLPAERRRGVYLRPTITYTVVGAYFALMVLHPFGLRNTFIYCLIVPFLVLAPLSTLAVGIRAHRQRGRR